MPFEAWDDNMRLAIFEKFSSLEGIVVFFSVKHKTTSDIQK